MKEILTLNTQEQKRLLVLNRLLCADLTMQEAATLLGLSTRQVRRILAAYRKEGAAAVVYGNRGRQPAHTISQQERTRVVEVVQTTYAGATSNTCATCWKNVKASGSRAPASTASCRPPTCYLAPPAARRSIDGGTRAWPRKACWCKLMGVAINGWDHLVPG